MSHVTYWISQLTFMNALCHVYGWVMSHTSMRRVIHMDGYCHIPQCVWMSLVTYINESCHTFDPSMSHTSMHHVINNEWWCHIHPWVMSHIRMCTWTRRLTYINEYDWVMSHISMICMNGSCYMHQWRTLRTSMSHVTFIRECVRVRGQGAGGCKRSLTHHTYTYIHLHKGH